MSITRRGRGGIAATRRARRPGRWIRRWPVAITTILGLTAAIAIVWSGQEERPGNLVAEAADTVSTWGGITYRGSIDDEDEITASGQLTVTAEGAAHGTLAREFGAAAEIAADAGGVLINGNREWWLTDQPAAAEVLAGVWVDGPPTKAIGLQFGLPPGPSALAAELSTPGAQPWSEIGRESGDGRAGILLTDGVRRVLVSVDTPRRLLSVTLPRRGPPQVVPRAFIAQPSDPVPPDQEPAPQYVENFTIDEPTGADLQAARSAAKAIRHSALTPAVRSLAEFLDQDGSVDAETVELLDRLGGRGINARAAVAVPSPYGKSLLQVLDAITKDITGTGEQHDGAVDHATLGILKAVRNRQFAALHEVATDGNLRNPEALRTFLQGISAAGNKRHLEAVARLTAAGNEVRMEVPYQQDAKIDWVVDVPADAGTRPSNNEHKAVDGSDDKVRSNVRAAAKQLAGFNRAGQAAPGSENRIQLHFSRKAANGLGRLGSAEELKARLAALNLYQACVDGGDGTSCAVDWITVTTDSTYEGRPVVISHEYRPEELRPDPPPGGSAATPDGPAPGPPPDSGAEAPEPTSLFAGPEGTVQGRGALQHAAAQPGTDTLGGIDFSSLELRYLAERDTDDGRSMRYAFAAHPLADALAARPAADLHSAQQASDAFFVWLALPTSAFTVNLNPDEPERIVDPRLGGTDAGRILLEADLRMKKTVGELIRPDSPLGARYWDAISSTGEQTCQSFRQWIVPAPAEVSDTGEELYILDAPLQVKMETEYLKRGGAGGGTACPQQSSAVEERNEEMFRTMILPEVERAVNEAPEYADLRQVYLSRVAAEWYRQRSATESLSFTHLIDKGDVAAWPARVAWSPRDVFDRYVDSFTNGEFNVTRETRSGNVIETRTYVYGGVDWTQIPFRQETSDQLRSRWPQLATTVGDSFRAPTADREGRIWLSSASSIPSPVDGHAIGLSTYLAVGTIMVGVGLAVRSGRRVRRANRAWLAGRAAR